MTDKINSYGDQRVATVSGHGVDVASQRADDLDQMALRMVQGLADDEYPVKVLDVGCGHGGQAARMAGIGVMVVACDIEDYEAEVRWSMGLMGFGHQDANGWPWIFCQASIETLPEDVGPFEVIVCQRMIHYLRYGAAQAALARLGKQVWRGDDCFLYISASGISSELGDGYAGKDVPVQERFDLLAPAMAEKHAIYPPVCLYSEAELRALLEGGGWRVDTIFTSAFGNVKAVARWSGS